MLRSCCSAIGTVRQHHRAKRRLTTLDHNENIRQVVDSLGGWRENVNFGSHSLNWIKSIHLLFFLVFVGVWVDIEIVSIFFPLEKDSQYYWIGEKKVSSTTPRFILHSLEPHTMTEECEPRESFKCARGHQNISSAIHHSRMWEEEEGSEDRWSGWVREF